MLLRRRRRWGLVLRLREGLGWVGWGREEGRGKGGLGGSRSVVVEKEGWNRSLDLPPDLRSLRTDDIRTLLLEWKASKKDSTCQQHCAGVWRRAVSKWQHTGGQIFVHYDEDGRTTLFVQNGSHSSWHAHISTV